MCLSLGVSVFLSLRRSSSPSKMTTKTGPHAAPRTLLYCSCCSTAPAAAPASLLLAADGPPLCTALKSHGVGRGPTQNFVTEIFLCLCLCLRQHARPAEPRQHARPRQSRQTTPITPNHASSPHARRAQVTEPRRAQVTEPEARKSPSHRVRKLLSQGGSQVTEARLPSY